MSNALKGSDVLKGNFTPKKSVTTELQDETDEDRFEKEALKRLGGSVCFVSKKKVMWERKDAP